MPWAFVQSNFAGFTSSNATEPVAYNSNVTANHLLLIAVAHNDPSTTVQQIADSQGNTYTQIGNYVANNNTTNSVASLWMAVAKSTGANTVTVTPSKLDYGAVGVMEWSTPGAPALDAWVGNTPAGVSTSLTTGSIAVNSTSDLVIGVFSIGGGDDSYTAGSGFTTRCDFPNASAYQGLEVVSAENVSTAQTATISTVDSAIPYAALGISLKVSGTGFTLPANLGSYPLGGCETTFKLVPAASNATTSPTVAVLGKIPLMPSTISQPAQTPTMEVLLRPYTHQVSFVPIVPRGTTSALPKPVYASTVQNFSLTANPGSLTLSGQAALLLRKSTVAALPTNFSLTGASAGLLGKRLVSATAGFFALEGQATVTARKTFISAASGDYTVTGYAASLLSKRTLLANSGGIVLAGQSAAVLHNRILLAVSGTVLVSGSSATLVASGIFALSANSGSVLLSGSAAALLHKYSLAATSGAVYLQGVSAFYTTSNNLFLSASPGVVSLAGFKAPLPAGRLSNASPASISISGQHANILHGYVLTADSSSLALTGRLANLLHAYAVYAVPGSVRNAGNLANVLYDRAFISSAGSFTAYGPNATISHNRLCAAASGIFTGAGQSASLLRTAKLLAYPTGYLLDGQVTVFSQSVYRLIAGPGGFTLQVEQGVLQVGTPIVTFPFLISTSRSATFTIGNTMSVQTNLNCPQGQDRVWLASYAAPTEIANENYSFTVKDVLGNTLLQVTSQSGGIITYDPTNGVLLITVSSAQMNIPVQQGTWSMWRTDSGFNDQVGSGLFTVEPSLR